MIKLLTLVSLFSTALREALVAKLVMLGLLFSIFFILALNTPFLTTSFLLHRLVYLNQQEQVSIYQHLIYLLFKLFKLVGRFFNFSISDLSTSDFKWAKSGFLAKEDVSTPVAFF